MNSFREHFEHPTPLNTTSLFISENCAKISYSVRCFLSKRASILYNKLAIADIIVDIIKLYNLSLEPNHNSTLLMKMEVTRIFSFFSRAIISKCLMENKFKLHLFSWGKKLFEEVTRVTSFFVGKIIYYKEVTRVTSFILALCTKVTHCIGISITVSFLAHSIVACALSPSFCFSFINLINFNKHVPISLEPLFPSDSHHI
ncbi:hypothetical protein AGLY_016061 [Aphis glycines]|uniref:Uncharacterized protein n=1 Tax=Aphis glycines TaxID=307491 RepID=A0A6G0SYV5_APHGL|nr:hypothetical protein AGLY_016061 [Aphis glycines]